MGACRSNEQLDNVNGFASEFIKIFKSDNMFYPANQQYEEQINDQTRKIYQVQLRQIEEQFQVHQSEEEKAYKKIRNKIMGIEEQEEQISESSESDSDEDVVINERVRAQLARKKKLLQEEEQKNKKMEEGEEERVRVMLEMLDEEYKSEKEKRIEGFKKEKQKLENNLKEKIIKRKVILMKLHQQFQQFVTNEDVIENFEFLYHINPRNALYLCNTILTKPTEEEVQENNAIYQRYQKIVEKQEEQDGVHVVLLAMKELYSERVLLFREKTSPKTQLSRKILFSGGLSNHTMFVEHIEQSEEWKFDELYENDEKKAQFIRWFQKQKAEEYKINENDILVTRLEKGSIKVYWAITETFFPFHKITTKKLHLHSYFQAFSLSSQDFDPQGNRQYQNSPFLQQIRGGWPYYLPIMCKRYGLRISHCYDSGDNKWLDLSGQKGEWAIAFHGVAFPYKSTKQGRILNCIMSGKDKGEMLIPGSGQAHLSDMARNNPKEKVGRGIYCSPHFEECFNYSKALSVGRKAYRLILQCKVNPKKIKVCRNEVYWVVNSPKDVRPYGVLLVKEKNAQKITSNFYLYAKKFKWENYIQSVNNFLAK